MARRSIIIDLRGKGMSYAQIAQKLKVRESFVRSIFGAAPQMAPPATPNGRRYAYQREALEIVLRKKERDAASIANDITRLKEQIAQLSALEASRNTLRQAIKEST